MQGDSFILSYYQFNSRFIFVYFLLCKRTNKALNCHKNVKFIEGDQIMAVNGTNVTKMMQEDVAAMLKTCGTGKVTIKVGRWKLMETAQRIRLAQPPECVTHL